MLKSTLQLIKYHKNCVKYLLLIVKGSEGATVYFLHNIDFFRWATA